MLGTVIAGRTAFIPFAFSSATTGAVIKPVIPLFQAFSPIPAQRSTYCDCIKVGRKIAPACGSGNFLTETYLSVHMAWTRVVCGRLGEGYRYSPAVYNNFPWPAPTPAQKATIEHTAQGILNARDLYPDRFYDPLTMTPELRKAHQNNDRAVMAAYGFSTKMSESDCVAELMKMYQKLIEEVK